MDTFAETAGSFFRPKPRETVFPVSPAAVRLYQAYKPLLLSGRGFGPDFDAAMFDLLLVSPPSGEGNRILLEGLRTFPELQSQPDDALLIIIAEQRKQLATPEHRLETLIAFVEQRFSHSDAMPFTRADLDLLEDDYFRLTGEEQGDLTIKSQEIYSNYLSWVEMRRGEADAKMPLSAPARPAPLIQSKARIPVRNRFSALARTAGQTAARTATDLVHEARQLGQEARVVTGDFAGQVRQKIREARTAKPKVTEVSAGPREIKVRKITSVERKVENIEIEDTIASNAVSVVHFSDRFGKSRQVMIISEASGDINRVRILDEEGNEIRMGHVMDAGDEGADIELFAVNIDLDRNGNIKFSPYSEDSRSPRVELVFSSDTTTDETVSRISFVSRQDFRRNYQVKIEELQADDMRNRAVQRGRKFASGTREQPRRIQRTFYRHEPILIDILGPNSTGFLLPEKILSATEDLQLLDENGNAHLLRKVKPRKLFPYRGWIQNNTYSVLARSFRLTRDDAVYQLTFKSGNNGWRAESADFSGIADTDRQIYIIRRKSGKKEVVVIDQSGQSGDLAFRQGVAIGSATRDEEITFERAFEIKSRESVLGSPLSEARAILSAGHSFEINLNNKRYALVWKQEPDTDPYLLDENGRKQDIFGIDPGLSDRIGQYYTPIQGLNLPKDARRFGFTLREDTEDFNQPEKISLGKLLGRAERSPSIFICKDEKGKTRAFLLTPPQECIEITEITASNQAFAHYENVVRGTHGNPDVYSQVFPPACDQIVLGSLIGDGQNVREAVIQRIKSKSGLTRFQAVNLATGEIIRTPGVFKKLSTLIDRYALSGNPMLIDLSARLGDSRNAVFTMEVRLDTRRPFSYQSPVRLLEENRKNHLADVVVVEDHSSGQLLCYIVDESLAEVRSGSIMNSGTGLRVAGASDRRLARIRNKIRTREKGRRIKRRLIPLATHTAVSAASIAAALGIHSYLRPIESVVTPSGETSVSFSLPVVRFVKGQGLVTNYTISTAGDYLPSLPQGARVVSQSLLPSVNEDAKVGKTDSVISEGEVHLTWNNINDKYIPPAYSARDVDGVHNIPEGFGEQINILDENGQQLALLGSRNTIPFLSVSDNSEITVVQNLQTVSSDGSMTEAVFGEMADGTPIKANNAGNLIYQGDADKKIYRTPFHDGVPQFLILADGQIVGFAPDEANRQSIYVLKNPEKDRFYAQNLYTPEEFQKSFGLTARDFDAHSGLEKSLTFNLQSPQKTQLAITEEDGVLVYQNLYDKNEIHYPDFGKDKEGNQLKAYATPYCYGTLTCKNIYAIPAHDDLPTIFVLEDGTFLGVLRDVPGLLPDPNAAVFRTDFATEINVNSFTSDADLFQKLLQAKGQEVVLSDYRYEPYELVTQDGKLFARKSYQMTRVLSEHNALSIKPDYIPAVYQRIEKDNSGNQVETHRYFIINPQNGRMEYVAYGLVDEFGDGRNIHPKAVLRRGLTVQREEQYSTEVPNPNREILQREAQRVRDHIQWYLDAYDMKSTVDEVLNDPSLISDAGIISRIQYLKTRLAQAEPQTIEISGTQIVQKSGQNVWSLWESDFKNNPVIRVVDPDNPGLVKSLLIPLIVNEVNGRQWALVYEEAQITPYAYQRQLIDGGYIEEPLYVVSSSQLKREKTEFPGISVEDYLKQNSISGDTIEYLDSYGRKVAYAVVRGIDQEVYDEIDERQVLSGQKISFRAPNVFLILDDQGNPVYAYFGESGINVQTSPVTFTLLPTPYDLDRADYVLSSRGEDIRTYQDELQTEITPLDPSAEVVILTKKGELVSLNDQNIQEMSEFKELPLVILSLNLAESEGMNLDSKIFVYSGRVDPYSGSLIKEELPLSEVVAKILEGGSDKQKYLDALVIRFNLGRHSGDRSSIHTVYDLQELNEALTNRLLLGRSEYFQDEQSSAIGLRSSPFELTKLIHDLFQGKIVRAETLTLLENLLTKRGEISLISRNSNPQMFSLTSEGNNSQGITFEIIRNGDQEIIIFSRLSDEENFGIISDRIKSIIQRLQGLDTGVADKESENPLKYITINEYTFREDQIFTSVSATAERDFHDIVNQAINADYATGEEFVLAINQAMITAGYGDVVSSKTYQEQIDLVRRDYRKIKKQPVQCISFAGVQKAFVEFYGGKLPNITGLTREDGSRITAAEHYIDTDFKDPKVQYALFWNISQYRVLNIGQIEGGDYLVTRDGHIAYVTKVLNTSDGPLVIIDQANRNNDGRSSFDALNKNNIEQKLDPFGQFFILRGADNKLPPSSSSPQGSRSPHVRPSLMPYSNVEYRFNPASGWQEPYDSNTGRFISPQELAETLALQITASSGPSISNSVNASVQTPDKAELARLRETPRSQRQDRTSQRAQLRNQVQRARLIPRKR